MKELPLKELNLTQQEIEEALVFIKHDSLIEIEDVYETMSEL
jgi:hypothetical protein